MVSYGKWDALDSDDDGPPKPKAQPVRKQAVAATRESELAAQAEESRLASAELARLQERAEKLQREMEEYREQMLATKGDSDTDPSAEYSDDFESADDVDEEERNADESAAGSRSEGPAPRTPIRRRRGLDREHEVDVERVFEARPAPDGGRGQSIVAEFRSVAEAVEVADAAWAANPEPSASDAPNAAPSETAKPSAEDKEFKKSSLRRLKELDQELSTAIQRECGVDLSKQEVFRLIMDNRGSCLKKHTSVLVLAVGEKFLCPEPRSKVVVSETTSAEAGCHSASSATASNDVTVAEAAPLPEAVASTVPVSVPSCAATVEDAPAGSAASVSLTAAEDAPASSTKSMSNVAQPTEHSGGSVEAEGAPAVQDVTTEGDLNDSESQAAQATGGPESVAEAGEVARGGEMAGQDGRGDAGPEGLADAEETARGGEMACQDAGGDAGPEGLAEAEETARGGEMAGQGAGGDAGLRTDAGVASSDPDGSAANGAGGDTVTAESPDKPSTKSPNDASEQAEGSVVVELRFFRATPRLPALAKKVGKVPILHVGITSSGLHQALEFLGIHQRKYYTEEPPSDAIARNLTESLLRVALEFVFHPSRSKYAKRHLVLRECSSSVEALESRDDLLPRMVERIRRMSKTIQEVSIELCTSSMQTRIGTDSKKDRSFLVVDEDALKAAPAEKTSSKAPAAAKSFRGLGKGFLNTSEAKKRGLSDHAAAETPSAASAEAASSSTAPEPKAEASSIAESIPAGERTRINPLPESDGPGPVQTDAEERAAMILPSADLYPMLPEELRKLSEHAPAGPAPSANGAETSLAAEAAAEEEESPDPSPQATLSALADQLFGELAQEEEEDPPMEEEEEAQTVSTQTPSPRAASSRDGGVASERPATPRENSGPGLDEEPAPAAGLRLLQQRRRAAAKAAAAQAPAEAAAAETRDESEDLVNLWMKQRW